MVARNGLACKKKTTLASRVRKGGGSLTYASGVNKGKTKKKGSLLSWIRSHPKGLKRKTTKKSKAPVPKKRKARASVVARDKAFLNQLYGYKL